MLSTLVLCDLDRTLLDVDQRPTDGGVREIITELAVRGITVGLASDSSYMKLDRWRQAFGIQGPIIGERGAFLQRSPSLPIEVLGPWAEYFQDFHEAYCAYVRRSLRTHRLVTSFSSTEGATLISHTGVDTPALFLNADRKCSFAVTTRMQTKGGLVLDVPLWREIDKKMRGFVERGRAAPFPTYWDANPDYGSIIIGAADAVKTLGVRTLLAAQSFDRVIMVGDSTHDRLDIDGVEHWAVANASEKYKAICRRVANRPLTGGVLELLQALFP